MPAAARRTASAAAAAACGRVDGSRVEERVDPGNAVECTGVHAVVHVVAVPPVAAVHVCTMVVVAKHVEVAARAEAATVGLVAAGLGVIHGPVHVPMAVVRSPTATDTVPAPTEVSRRGAAGAAAIVCVSVGVDCLPPLAPRTWRPRRHPRGHAVAAVPRRCRCRPQRAASAYHVIVVIAVIVVAVLARSCTDRRASGANDRRHECLHRGNSVTVVIARAALVCVHRSVVRVAAIVVCTTHTTTATATIACVSPPTAFSLSTTTCSSALPPACCGAVAEITVPTTRGVGTALCDPWRAGAVAGATAAGRAGCSPSKPWFARARLRARGDVARSRHKGRSAVRHDAGWRPRSRPGRRGERDGDRRELGRRA